MSDDDHVVSIDEYRHLTLQEVLREWAEIAREPGWCPADEDETAKLADVLQAAADALDGTLIADGCKWVRRKLPRGEGA
jgi:hypothetical protein